MNPTQQHIEFLDTFPGRGLAEGAEPSSHLYRALGGMIPTPFLGYRLDAYLAKHYRFLSREGWQRRIDRGEVLVRGKRVKPAYRLHADDLIVSYHPPREEPAADLNIELLWEEGGVMAVAKPGNLPMHENGRYRKHTVSYVLHEKFGREWAAVHRLDRETSGVVLCGATPEIRRSLSAALYDHRVRKTYTAIAVGNPLRDHWDVDGPIGDLVDSQIRIKKWVVDGGQPALTRFSVIEKVPGYALLEARPRTGRTNQIRIHAAFSDLPLLGDKLYNPDERVFLAFFEHGNTPEVQTLAGFKRHCLHAASLSFPLPFSHREVEVSAPLPPDFTEAWDLVRRVPAGKEGPR